MATTNSTPHRFTSHLELTAETSTPGMQSGRYDSVGDFLAATQLRADVDAPLETFEPASDNAWLSAGFAAAVAYRTDPSTPIHAYPFVLAVYVEGDVTYYRFREFADAAHAGWLWTIAG